jgi:hypothetical protein
MSETVPSNAPKVTPQAVLTAYREDQKHGPLARPLLLARVIAIVLVGVGAIPTGYNLYMSWKTGIPYSEVSHRLDQYNLWVRNFECKIDYLTVTPGQGTRVDVGQCPKTNDIALKVTTATGKSSYQWIAFDKLEQATKAAGLMSLVATPAEAQESKPNAEAKGLAPGGAVAPGGAMQVHCESMPQPGKVIRIVGEQGKCFREHIAIMLGRMERREEVPCNTTCNAAR